MIQEHIQHFHEERDEVAAADEDEYNEEFFEDFYYQHNRSYSKRNSKEELGVLEKLFKGSQLNKMYKRLAAKLHPDKESDATKKATKHDLMHSLRVLEKAKMCLHY